MAEVVIPAQEKKGTWGGKESGRGGKALGGDRERSCDENTKRQKE